MMQVLAHIVAWLNTAANAVGKVVLSPIVFMPGWLSATLIGSVTGVLLLAIFKYTSSQRAIKRVRDDINAHMLALKLFKDSALVALHAQGRILLGAIKLFVLALVPMLVMAGPVTLILAQIGLWYQSRPLQVGEEAVITLKLRGEVDAPWPEVRLGPTAGTYETTIGPIRILSRREICWNVKALQNGRHKLVFSVDDRDVHKELAVGDGFMRVSMQRPDLSWMDALLHPDEEPFDPDSPVKSIEIDYPRREGWTTGSDSWILYWFIVSMVAAFCFRRALNVHV